jgi:hypothetical protein
MSTCQEVATLTGHGDHVTDLAWSADKKVLASACWNINMVKVGWQFFNTGSAYSTLGFGFQPETSQHWML